MALVFLIGRVIVAYYFLSNAYNHIVKHEHLTGYAASKKVPSPKAAVIGSGILLLVGGLSVLLGAYPAWGLLALLLFMVPVTFKMHDYWRETDPMARMNARISFMKNLAIIGLVLMLYMVPQPWVYAF